MPSELSIYIINYGYLAIFLLVLIQGIGVPVPAPVEFVIMFCGYLIYKGLLSLPFVLGAIVIGDIIGTGLVYYILYSFGAYLLHRKPKWVPFSQKKVDLLTAKISVGGNRTIYIARFTPFMHGYISLIAGLMQIKPKVFLPILFLSALLWSLFYLMMGLLLAPYWSSVEHSMGSIKVMMLLAAIVLVAVFLFRYFRKKPIEKNL